MRDRDERGDDCLGSGFECYIQGHVLIWSGQVLIGLGQVLIGLGVLFGWVFYFGPVFIIKLRKFTNFLENISQKTLQNSI